MTGLHAIYSRDTGHLILRPDPDADRSEDQDLGVLTDSPSIESEMEQLLERNGYRSRRDGITAFRFSSFRDGTPQPDGEIWIWLERI